MNKDVIIADSSPLISLAIINKLEVLPQLYSKIIVPQAVWQEVTVRGKGLPGSFEVSKLEWLEIMSSNPYAAEALAILIDPGEAEVIALSMILPDSLVLLDDSRARRVAQRLNVRCIGTIGILRSAKKAGLINEVRTYINELREKGIYINQKLIDAVLKDMGE